MSKCAFKRSSRIYTDSHSLLSYKVLLCVNSKLTKLFAKSNNIKLKNIKNWKTALQNCILKITENNRLKPSFPFKFKISKFFSGLTIGFHLNKNSPKTGLDCNFYICTPYI